MREDDIKCDKYYMLGSGRIVRVVSRAVGGQWQVWEIAAQEYYLVEPDALRYEVMGGCAHVV
jgi:hypothetical protein